MVFVIWLKFMRTARGHYGRKSFTLVELLVVIAVIAIMAALLLPALARAKSKARTVICMNNKHQLALALRLYADDFRGYLPINDGDYGSSPTLSANWVFGWMRWDLDSLSTNSAVMLDPILSSLAPHTRSARIYKCPEDNYLSPVQRAAGWTERVRSVSMNQYVGNKQSVEQQNLLASPFPWFVYTRIDEARKLSPAQLWVFIDESADTIVLDVFGTPTSVDHSQNPLVSARGWLSMPSSLHASGCVLSFMDGHAEYKRWLDPVTKQPIKCVYRIWTKPSNPLDYVWLSERSTERRD